MFIYTYISPSFHNFTADGEEHEPDQPVFSLVTGKYRHAKRYGLGTLLLSLLGSYFNSCLLDYQLIQMTPFHHHLGMVQQWYFAMPRIRLHVCPRAWEVSSVVFDWNSLTFVVLYSRLPEATNIPRTWATSWRGRAKCPGAGTEWDCQGVSGRPLTSGRFTWMIYTTYFHMLVNSAHHLCRHPCDDNIVAHLTIFSTHGDHGAHVTVKLIRFRTYWCRKLVHSEQYY